MEWSATLDDSHRHDESAADITKNHMNDLKIALSSHLHAANVDDIGFRIEAELDERSDRIVDALGDRALVARKVASAERSRVCD